MRTILATAAVTAAFVLWAPASAAQTVAGECEAWAALYGWRLAKPGASESGACLPASPWSFHNSSFHSFPKAASSSA